MREESWVVLSRLQDRLSKYVAGGVSFIKAVCEGRHTESQPPNQGEHPPIVTLTLKLEDTSVGSFLVNILWGPWDEQGVSLVVTEIKGPHGISLTCPCSTSLNFAGLSPGQRTDEVAKEVIKAVAAAIVSWQSKGIQKFFIDAVAAYRATLLTTLED